jgi:hypothetical protein
VPEVRIAPGQAGIRGPDELEFGPRLMTKRKGEHTKAQVDRDYPHQVIILSRKVAGPQGGATTLFMANVNVASRTHSVMKDDEWHTVFCFADESHADQFIALFGGERFDPKTRGRGASWARLKSIL